MSGPNGNFSNQPWGNPGQPPPGYRPPPPGYQPPPPGYRPPQGWQQPPKKKTGLVVGLIVGVVLLALLGTGGWYLLSRAQAARELAASDERAVAAAVSAIRAIGQVDLDAEGRIVTAEKSFDAVRDEVRSEVSNRATLKEARGEFGAQLSELDETQDAVDAWRGAPACEAAARAQELIGGLNDSQVARLDGGDEIGEAVATCEREAEEQRVKAEKAEQERRTNLFKVSNYWFEEVGKGPSKGCLFQVTPEFTNLSPTETFQQLQLEVVFYNPDSSTAVDMAGVSTQKLTVTGPVAPGKLYRGATIQVNYDCGIDTVQIQRVGIDYASGGHDDLDGDELQYGSGWTKS